MGFWKTTKEVLVQSFKQLATGRSGDWKGAHYDFMPWANNVFGYKNNSLQTNEEIFSVVTRLANTVSSLPIHLYQNYDEVNNSLSNLLNGESNPSMTSFSLINQLETSRNTDGNGYAFIERDNTGTPIRLWPIEPSTVVVKRNLDDNSIWYEVNSSEWHFMVYNTEMIHVRHITPLDGVVGISPIDVLKGPLDFQKAVEDFSLSEMNKKDAYIIQYDRSVSDEKRRAMIEDFRRMIKENGGAVVQEKGFTFDRFESRFQPGDLKTTESITRSRIANAFNVPLAFLNENTGTSTGTLSEQLMIQFVKMTLVPIVKQYEAEFNRKLLTQSQRARGMYFKFNVNGLLRGDTAARTNFYQMMIRNGIASPNDLRKLEDLPPVKDDTANQLWITGDLYPIDLAIQDRNSREPSPESENAEPEKGGDTNDEKTKQLAEVFNRQAKEHDA
ncbi:phage portal protein [Limosilactobacillus mucosae]|uniref:phage portal protein n=1 Tax=Limosilactobacillus mucosae TaxID=97478 RepID=UPI000FFCA032|nr:phage portal protein [Limosilactobacillus mucosae]RXA58123.1 phage portal protein [Limosilactobacillus mucosae]